MPHKWNNKWECLKDMEAWLDFNFFKFKWSQNWGHGDGPSRVCDVSPLDLGPLQPYLKPVVTNLGVKMDTDFKLDKLSS